MVLERAGIRVTLGLPMAMRVDVDGVPFSTVSSLVAARPHYQGSYFNHEVDPKFMEHLKLVKSEPDAISARLELRGRETSFTGTQLFELTSSRKLRVTVDAKLLDPSGGQLEHKIAGIFPGWIAGTTYTTTRRDGTTTTGIVPRFPVTAGLSESTFVAGPEVTFDSRLGPLTIRAEGEPLRVVDYRRNRWAGPEPIFWCGILDRPLTATQPIRYTVEFQFPPPQKTQASEIHVADGVVSAPVVLREEQVPDLIIPTPN